MSGTEILTPEPPEPEELDTREAQEQESGAKPDGPAIRQELQTITDPAAQRVAFEGKTEEEQAAAVAEGFQLRVGLPEEDLDWKALSSGSPERDRGEVRAGLSDIRKGILPATEELATEIQDLWELAEGLPEGDLFDDVLAQAAGRVRYLRNEAEPEVGPIVATRDYMTPAGNYRRVEIDSSGRERQVGEDVTPQELEALRTEEAQAKESPGKSISVQEFANLSSEARRAFFRADPAGYDELLARVDALPD